MLDAVCLVLSAVCGYCVCGLFCGLRSLVLYWAGFMVTGCNVCERNFQERLFGIGITYNKIADGRLVTT